MGKLGIDLNRLGPYELNTIVTGDARELAGAIPDNSVDFAFADPPYWVSYDYGDGRNDNTMDYIDPVWLVKELTRVAKVACITPGIANIWEYPKADWVISWNKPASNGRSGIGGFNVWEPVLLYGKPEKRIWQDAVSLHAIQHRAADGEYFFKCPKPLALMDWLIEGITSPGNIVIDMMVGSGTTCISARKLGRNYLAFEIDPITAARARERVLLTQAPLFVMQPAQLVLSNVEGWPGE